MTRMYGSLDNRLSEGQQIGKEIFVGMGATQMMYTDQHAYEVVEVLSQTRCMVRQCDAIRTDKNGMDEIQQYKYILQPYKEWKNTTGKKCNNNVELRKCKRGWKEKGVDIYFLMGVKREYYDYSF